MTDDHQDKAVGNIAGPVPYRRPTWDEYFMEVANAIAKRATCNRGRSGCVIARDRTILVTGYVGSPKGFPHCDDVGHLMKRVVHEDGSVTEHCVRTVHAEANAILQAARHGVRIEGAEIYVTASPCWDCFKLITNAGIVKVLYGEFYRDERILAFARDAGIELVHLGLEDAT